MSLPARPVDGAEIATDWGQTVHDYTFAPAGGIVSGADVTASTGSLVYRTLPLDTAVDDPGGWLDSANDRLEVPTDGAGLYLFRAWVRSDEGATADSTRAIIRVNGTEVARATEGNEGSTAISVVIVTPVQLVEGDQVDVRAAQWGTGARATLGVVSLFWVRLGAEFGTP
jgi:hypothetical protein